MTTAHGTHQSVTANCMLILQHILTEPLDFVSAPTVVPTISEGKPVDECDDDQANCHSGTGDDYQLTGAETILIPLQLHCSSYPSPVIS